MADYENMTLAERMASNANPSKAKAFTKGFNKALGSTDNEDDKEDGKQTGVLAAMKRVIVGG